MQKRTSNLQRNHTSIKKKKKNHVANFTDVKYILYLDDRTEIQGSEDSIFNVTHYIDLRRLMKLSGQKSRTKMKMPD